MRTQVDELLQRAYRPYRALPDLLRALVHELAERERLAGGCLRLHCGCSLDVCPARSRAKLARPFLHRTLPINYAEESLGELQLEWSRDAAAEAAGSLCEDFARRCAYLVKRYEVQAWAEQRLRRPLLLVGVCEALHQLEIFIEKAAYSCLPVMLKGEFGTEKVQLAAAVHCCGPHRDGPFVEVNCANPAGQPAQWFRQASGGTLFFNGIEELAPALQGQLPQYLHSRLGQWLAVPTAGEPRVIASATADLAQRVREGGFSRALLAELDFLVIEVPPLRERLDDIESLVAVVLERHGFDVGRALTAELLHACRRHNWPENLFEMERVVARLAVMAGGRPIRATDIQVHAPWMLEAGALAGREQPPRAPVRVNGRARSESHWVECAVARDLAALSGLHEALRRALLYLGEHYAKPLSLGELARQAHVSPSHLGFLFRSALGTTFKPLLQRIRIEKAKEMLHADEHQRITDVALSVGFGDLSHFEKSFRRLVGRSPREFRRAAGT